ncbi:MAG TPA: glycosyltransferase family 2 protein, partial [Spirochaetales bacterium]|nr:glycosyltransferase family 2 protein [Spirochaetales bacterium]
MPPERLQITLILLHYGALRDTRECLHSLLASRREPVPVIVVLNGAEGEVASALRTEFPWTEVLVTGGNIGFAAGNNIGIRRALEDGASHIVLLNNDTVVEPGFLDSLAVVFCTYPEAGMVTGPVLHATPPNPIWSAGGKMGGWTALTRHSLVNQPRSALPQVVQETEYANGCFVMVSRRCIETVGLMDEGYFLYYEDTDWCARVREAGFKMRKGTGRRRRGVSNMCMVQARACGPSGETGARMRRRTTKPRSGRSN